MDCCARRRRPGARFMFGARRAARACRARRFLVHKANTQSKSRASTKAVRGSLPRARPPGVREKGRQQVMSSVPTNIESVLHEERVFPPPAEFAERAHVKSMEELEALRREAHDSPEEFWGRLAESELQWFKKWDAVLRWEPPHAEWFVGGRINVSYNCLDRHLSTWRRNKAAIIWEGEPGEQRTLTYGQLQREVSRFANVLKRAGVERGDRVALYMPPIPGLAGAMPACGRLGA